MNDNSNEQGDYKSPPASIDNNNDSWGPFSKRKVPLDDNHICPMCDGKGYVHIVKEQDVSRVPRRVRRDVRGNLISD